MCSDNADTRRDHVKTTVATFEMLEYLSRQNGATLTELSEEFELAKSTVHRHMTTLADLEYVIKDGSEYFIGLKFLQLSEQARHRKPGYQVARDKVFELVDETGERALFLVEELGRGVYMYRAGGTPPFRNDTMVGERRPLHALAAGKAILAQWDENRLDSFLDNQDLWELTRNTITDPEALLEELTVVRDQGHAINDSEQIEGLRAVGVPVFGPSGCVIGGLSVFGPVSRLNGEKFDAEVPEILKDKAHEIHVQLSLE
ncbi:IclR family transcriptional regulator [Natronosalvus rutilus]|uniref:IclR family transcriptional regulator n=1 Tax=Natronosalvus rutilus TaxID=2953753 RepID=A0A9E7NDT1_9EURY|nr:IclR family transcriptional regulator [Natronosalvus rutilus]UTF55651.1 IclR family transcriptional regulator [Natronosalvus rutilus]